jgi:hypothetical protein
VHDSRHPTVHGGASGSGDVGAHNRILPQGARAALCPPPTMSWRPLGPNGVGRRQRQQLGPGKANHRMGWGPHVIDTKRMGGITYEHSPL